VGCLTRCLLTAASGIQTRGTRAEAQSWTTRSVASGRVMITVPSAPPGMDGTSG
jgi:hypothetical protein